jgi:hypothetical protein
MRHLAHQLRNLQITKASGVIEMRVVIYCPPSLYRKINAIQLHMLFKNVQSHSEYA